MILISNTLINKFSCHEPVINRINVAWVKDKQHLLEIISQSPFPVLIDYPQNRIKPPQNNINLKDILLMDKIKYLALSNFVKNDIHFFQETSIQIIPKIETKNGILDLEDIISAMNYDDKIVMLDHDDLFNNCGDISIYRNLMLQFQNKCTQMKVSVLSTIGVVFSTTEHLEKFTNT